MKTMAGVALCVAVLVGLPCSGSAQVRVRLLEVGFDQSFTSPGEWDSPAGFMAALELGGLPRHLGLRVGYRTLSEPGAEVAAVCSFASCVDGPFSQSYGLKNFWLGLTSDVGSLGSTRLALSLNGSLYSQVRRLRHLETGARSTRGEVFDLGVGPGVTLRLPDVTLGLRPIVYGRYERVFQGGCDADASCYGDRNVASFGVTLGWGR